jgi:hypothetical protein
MAIVPEELTDMWIWVVGSEVKQNVMVPADFNLLKFPDKSSHGKILDLC